MASRYDGPKIVNGRLTQQGECFWERRAGRKRRSAVFKCSCGTSIITDHNCVVSGTTTTCGCRRNEPDGSNRLTHGATSRLLNGNRTRGYVIWAKMHDRCRNKNNPKFKSYGGRWISVCETWQTFIGFIGDMGEPPIGMSIDRIDFNGGYEKGNCRWATAKEQANNTRANVIVVLDGQSMTLKQAAEKAGVNYKSLWKNFRFKGFSLEESIAKSKRVTND